MKGNDAVGSVAFPGPFPPGRQELQPARTIPLERDSGPLSWSGLFRMEVVKLVVFT